jgi:antitoxin (DNA-binding transcriptional repressor) of toxin-antitoxin stability system
MQLSRLVDRAANGEEIIITKSRKAVARLVSYARKAQPGDPALCVARFGLRKTSTRRYRKIYSLHLHGSRERCAFASWREINPGSEKKFCAKHPHSSKLEGAQRRQE